MQKQGLQNLSDDELRAKFRQHNIRGMVISISLLAIFLFLYFVPLDLDPDIKYNVFIVLIVASGAFGLWYNISKRKYFKEINRRGTHF